MSSILENLSLQPDQKSFRRFVRLYIGQSFSLIGSEIVAFSIIWWMTVETINATLLSLAMFANFLPCILFTSIAGVLADRLNKKHIMIITDSIQAILTILIIILFRLNFAKLWIIMVINAFRSTCQTFQGPASSSIIPLMVPKDKLSRMNGFQQLISSIITLIAPILAASLFTLLEIHQILWIDVFTFVAAFGFLIITKIPVLHHPQVSNKETKFSPSSKQNFLNDMKNSFTIFKEYRGLLAFIVLIVVVNAIISPINVLLSFFIYIEHGGTATQVALVGMSFQAGMILSGILVSIKKEWHNKIFIFIVGIIITITCMGLLGFVPTGQFWIMYIIGFIMFSTTPIISAISITLIQSKIPVEKMGRVLGNIRLLKTILIPISYLIVGPIAELISVGNLFIVSAVIGMVLVIIVYFSSELRKLNDSTFGSHIHSKANLYGKDNNSADLAPVISEKT